ncbi:threonylcarbamoyl-AMP synthase [Enterococcus sp. 669A]|uniref:L-threonylcarbamoyladenylate synthase n=1 Tax=Candidatus Enterococcus moelleringii TaxID=2815325 RepID=A0ABS3L7D7_9ENTE|nr:L-threonylcarbamoyladenylate synthase [Enterococcus sp. 669A]MBO1305534.1 threonylcarbamoyl-AMP synthase [Enterococcus sp. 669A]
MRKKILAPSKANYQLASQCIQDGGVIVAPSDTNLALTLDPWNEEAIERAFAIKNRPADSALTLFFLEPSGWQKYALTSNKTLVEKLVTTFWPGPLNIILEAKDNVPKKMLCGGDTVSMSCLSNPVWRGFMETYQQPVTMTSANLSGQADGVLVDMEMVLAQVSEAVDYILAGEAQGTTTSSTIIDLTAEPPIIVRLGDITAEDIEAVLGVLPQVREGK